MLTKRTSESFLKYVIENHGLGAWCFVCRAIIDDDVTPIWGYLLAFFDSVGIEIDVRGDYGLGLSPEGYIIYLQGGHSGWEDTRIEGQIEAIKKACMIRDMQILGPEASKAGTDLRNKQLKK